MTEDLHVFVSGTLKPGAANFDRYCGNKVVSSHRAYIYGELYDLPLSGYPGAIHGIRKVYGFVMSFNDIKILQELDELCVQFKIFKKIPPIDRWYLDVKKSYCRLELGVFVFVAKNFGFEAINFIS